MGDVLISLDSDAEKTLRELAHELHGGKKGSLSETIAELLSEKREEVKKTRARKVSLERLIKIMEKGYPLGNKEPYKKRSELYESRVKDLY